MLDLGFRVWLSVLVSGLEFGVSSFLSHFGFKWLCPEAAKKKKKKKQIVLGGLGRARQKLSGPLAKLT